MMMMMKIKIKMRPIKSNWIRVIKKIKRNIIKDYSKVIR